ncbi:hypothetical protein [Ideonella sp. B508-1]|uniref:hypothetical protein n=1 Tax=Ideonella sp. B508-1 TaxID=137716 RepID=UPI0003B3B84E|nr:hypothetical protein [Ideonella sp. B508-1]
MSNPIDHNVHDYSPLLRKPHSLEALLTAAHPIDLAVLSDYLTDEGKGRLVLDSGVTTLLNRSKSSGHFDAAARAAIERELLLFGGNSVANVFRRLVSGGARNSGGICYEELVRDVAGKLGAPTPGATNVLGLERRILERLLQQALDKAAAVQRSEVLAGLSGWKSSPAPVPESIDDRPDLWAAIGAVVAAGTGEQLLQRSVVGDVAGAGAFTAGAAAALRGVAGTLASGGAYGAAAGFAGARAVTALAGPVGLTVGGVWTLASLASPAYRVTVPCVIQLAFMRSSYLALARQQSAAP